MEFEFGKHFKDATNLLLMMDHDSGYVEGTETCTSSSNESDPLKGSVAVDMKERTDPENFLLSEDALLEKPEIYINLGTFANEINNEDYEETRRLFFSPEVIQSSVKSQDSSIVYSGLENESSSELSDEIPLQAPIAYKMQQSYTEVQCQIQDMDISTTSASDMSLEVSMFDPVIIEKKNESSRDNCSSNGSVSPFKGFSLTQRQTSGSAINIVSLSESASKTNQDISETREHNVSNNTDYNLDVNKVENSNFAAPQVDETEKILESQEEKSQNSNVERYFPEDKTMAVGKSPVASEYSDKVSIKRPNLDICDSVIANPLISNCVESSVQTSNIVTGCCGSNPETPKPTDGWKVGKIQKRETPSKSNPLTAVTNTFEASKDKRRLTLVFSKSEKENAYMVKRKYPSLTPDKNYKNPINSDISPDIFGDEVVEDKPSYFEIQSKESLLSPLTKPQIEEKYLNKLDQKLLKRTQKGMSGVLPPPSLTIINMCVGEILSRLEQNKRYFWDNDNVIEKDESEAAKDTSLNSSGDTTSYSKSLLINVDLEKAKVAEFPKVLNLRHHGLHHNCSKISEEIVDLCDKYQKRFVGAETQSTCTVFEVQSLTSPSKRKMLKPRWGGKSPGRRLSHLARRRITFSSANLQAGGSSLAGSRARQILVDAKKIDLLNRRKSPRKSPRKTPKKTPRKSPKVKTRTPSSSAKKKLAMRFRKLTGEFEKSVPSTSEMSSVHRALFKSPDKGTKSESSKGGLNKSTKRALFQSPGRDKSSSLFTSKSQDYSASGEKSQLRRALFTSPRKISPLKSKKSPFKQALKFGAEKRKRSESDDLRPSKFSRSMSMDVRPSSSTSVSNKSFTRAQSELNISLNRSNSQVELTDQHKKKLQWAVYGALQMQNVTNSHAQWKTWASVLARVTHRFYANEMASKAATGAKLEGGTTERMNRIARRHVLSVIKGKTMEEIISEYVSSRPRVHKPQGYVAPEDFHNVKNKMSSDIKGNVFQDRINTIESWEKKKMEQMSKSTTENKIERIRKVINFGDDR